jgi:phosphoribosylglycinamide formyltransferase-1
LQGFTEIPARYCFYPNKNYKYTPSITAQVWKKDVWNECSKAVVANKEKETGITIHYVNEDYDKGGVVFQKKVILMK